MSSGTAGEKRKDYEPITVQARENTVVDIAFLEEFREESAQLADVRHQHESDRQATTECAIGLSLGKQMQIDQ